MKLTIVEKPSAIPMFSGSQPKRRKESLSETIAESIVVCPQSVPDPRHVSSASPSASIGVSPGKSVDLRMKNLQQLSSYFMMIFYLNKEQKQFFLDSLRKLD